MSISKRLHEVKEFVVKELEAIASEAEKVAPVVETAAAAVATAVPGLGGVAAVAAKVAGVVADVVGCCDHRQVAHTQGGCSVTDCKCPNTQFGARNAGAPA